MTARTTDDLVRSYFLDRASDGPPPDLLARSLSRTAVASQKRPWWTGLRQSLPQIGLSARALRLAYVGLVTMALLGAFLLGGTLVGNPTDSPAPTASPSQATGVPIDAFIRPFEWTPMDPQADHRIVPYRGPRDPVAYHWLDEASSISPDGGLYGSQVVGEYGIAIASAANAQPSPCPDEAPPLYLRQSPTNLLFDLRAIGGAGIDPAGMWSLDGRQALFADLDPTRNLACARELIVNRHLGASEVLLLTLPSRFIVADINGETIIVQIWAQTAAGLVAWLPEATRFVDGIRFLHRPEATSAPVHVDLFSMPFDYTPIAGGQIGPARNFMDPPVYHWVHDPGSADATEARNDAQAFGEYGIAIAWAGQPWTYECAAEGTVRKDLRREPADLLADLRTIAGAGFGPERASTFDGWPALVADLDPVANNGCGDQIAFTNFLSEEHFLLTLPSRFIVAEFYSDTVIVVQIWARTADGLIEWLPAASRFVEDIHFSGGP